VLNKNHAELWSDQPILIKIIACTLARFKASKEQSLSLDHVKNVCEARRIASELITHYPEVIREFTSMLKRIAKLQYLLKREKS